jgi:hypothetical protein
MGPDHELRPRLSHGLEPNRRLLASACAVHLATADPDRSLDCPAPTVATRARDGGFIASEAPDVVHRRTCGLQSGTASGRERKPAIPTELAAYHISKGGVTALP